MGAGAGYGLQVRAAGCLHCVEAWAEVGRLLCGVSVS